MSRIFIALSKKSAAFCGFITLVVLGLGLSPVKADEEDNRYTACLEKAQHAPDRAINEALVWLSEGDNDMRARHCEAVGLFYLGEYGEAAIRLQNLAADIEAGKGLPAKESGRAEPEPTMIADIYAQSANAWLLAGELVRAETTIESALALTRPASSLELELRFDRARIVAGSGDYKMALEDLSYILKYDSGRKDILVFVASAARSIKQYDRAKEAIEAYLEVYPRDPAGYLEQANLHDAMGNRGIARKNWLKVLQLEETGINADAARANLERIDANIGNE